MANLKKLTPCLWFDKDGEEAVDFYVSVFKNSAKGKVSRYGKVGFEQHRMPEGTAMTVEFVLEGENFLALNAGPAFKFTEAISFIISCDTQEEVDHFWNKLTEGGNESMCGWLKDKYGLSWQVTPVRLMQLMTDPDKAKAGRVMNAMMQMKKIDIAKLEEAANGK